MLLSISICSAAKQDNKTLTVTKMWPPEANYSLTKDADDINQLTDGILVRKPLWIKKNAIGWQLTEVIRLELELIGDNTYPVNGSIGIHMPCGNKSGVFFPEFIDLYENNKKDNQLLASKKFPEECRDGSYWEKISFESSSNKLLLIIKPRNRLFTLDEVSFFNEVSEKTSTSRTAENIARGINAYKVVNPYSAQLKMIDNKEPIVLTGIEGEWESFAFNVSNGTDADSEILIQSKGLGADTKFFEIASVTTATEKKVNDALLTIKNDSFTIQKNSSKTIWIKTKLKRGELSATNGSISFSKREGDIFASFPVTKKIISCDKKAESPFVVNWAYLNESPICKNHKSQCVKDNIDHNTNVFVVPPYRIPKITNVDDQEKNKLFSDYISHIPNDNKLLLFISLLQYKSLIKSIENGDPGATLTIKKWLLTVNNILTKNGFDKNGWAIYALDEPVTKHAKLLVDFFSIVNDIDSEVKIYENPTDFLLDEIPVKLLAKFYTHVDYMQPLKRYYDQYESLYRNYNGSLWVYDIPEPPAKELSPFWYRNLSVNAWANELKGVGFWSYDGTSKTSAWNDSDGYRADYAVVYESENGPVSGRRWEAFSEGVEDYKLFSLYEKHYPNQNVEVLREKLKSVANDQLEYMKTRKIILDDLDGNGCQYLN